MFDQKLGDLDVCHTVVDILLGDLQDVFQGGRGGLSEWVLFDLYDKLFDVFW